mmetsp:Transcript_19231/g.49624  ORF Transcript_19231/g.49624 Transcript_19231/m.49624 type:complete len:260 (+) Transcript_19231:1328-2107(+)
MVARMEDQMPSAPISTSPRTSVPSSRFAMTPPPGRCVYESTPAPLRTMPCPSSPSMISCKSGRSTTQVKGMPLSAAGVFKSNIAYHSLRMPSLIPFVRLPVQVALASILSYNSRFSSFKFIIALDASWMGPPKRLNAEVFSITVTLILGMFPSALASVRPPTPAPATSTCKGSSSVIESDAIATSAVAVATAVKRRFRGERRLFGVPTKFAVDSLPANQGLATCSNKAVAPATAPMRARQLLRRAKRRTFIGSCISVGG